MESRSLRLLATAATLTTGFGLSCKDPKATVEKNVTGINLRVAYDPRLELDELAVTARAGVQTLFQNQKVPETPRPLSAAGEAVAILVGDQWVSTPIDITVDGYASGVARVSKTTQILLKRGALVNATLFLDVACVDATECADPSPCEVADQAQCVLAQCQYEPAPDETTRCPLPGDPTTELRGYCIAGSCDECTTDADCVTPPGSTKECFDATCNAAHTCEYELVETRSCQDSTCAGGFETSQRLCGADGSCPDAGNVPCGAYQCNVSASACLTSCAADANCVSGYYCSGTTCVPVVANGDLCVGEGDHACLSGHCDDTRCCAGGDCCGSTAADCPASYSSPPACTNLADTTDCQGRRKDAACSPNHVCYSVFTDDDRGCAGTPHACSNNMAPIVCTDVIDQTAPQCPAICTTLADCITGYVCQSDVCTIQPGLGDTCTGAGQGTCLSGYKCDQGVCCDSGRSEHCCTSAGQCANGLNCNLDQYYCYEGCTAHTSDQCAVSTSYCVGGTQCSPKLADGLSCSDNADCQNAHCVEGVCCESACGTTCQSCLAAYTGQSNGLCRNILINQTDIGPPDLCSATVTSACSGASCACNGSAQCKLASGQVCTADANCASANCECSNAACSQKKCSTTACTSCRFNANGDATCEGNIGDGSSDGTCSALTCNGQGACHLANGATCTTDTSCETHHCICQGMSCTTKVCGVSTCPDQDLGSVLGDHLVDGDTTTSIDHSDPSCDSPGSSPDRQYRWTAPAAGRYSFEVYGNYDVVMSVLNGACGGTELACSDADWTTTAEHVILDLTSGQTVIIVADGYPGNQGTFYVGIHSVPVEGAYWALDEGTGSSIADSSGHGNTGTISGALWRTGKYGSSLEFNGTTNYVRIPNSSSIDIGGNAFSISMWLRIVDAITDYAIVEKPWSTGSQGTPPYQYGVEFDGDFKTADLYFGDTNANGRGPYSMPVPVGATVTAAPWTHVVFTYDGSTVKGYVDGVQQLSTGASGSIQTHTTDLYFGQDAAGGQLYKGRIDDVRIYNRTLSPSEVTALP